MSVASLVKHAGISINMLITILSFVNTGFMDVSLARHLEQEHGLSIRTIGGLFFLTSAVYVVTNQASAFLIHKHSSSARPLVLAGFTCSALMFLLSGPMFPLSFEETTPVLLVKQVLFGLSIGPQLVGSFFEGTAETKRAGFPSGEATSAAFSALFTTSMTLGYSVCLFLTLKRLT